MKEIKSDLIVIICVILFFCMPYFLFTTAMDNYSNKLDEYIGKKVIIEKDTLLIKDYDRCNFIFSNGLTIPISNIDNFKILVK